MKEFTFKNCAAQGDLLITRVQEIPEGAVRQAPKDNVHIVAHSETGHHHVVDAEPVEYFWAQSSNDQDFSGQVAYLRVNKPVTLRHLRSFDTHAPIQIGEGIFRLNQQREYTPEGLRRAAD